MDDQQQEEGQSAEVENEAEAKDVQLWLDRIKRAEKKRDSERDEQGWKRFIEEYRGKYNLDGLSAKMAVPPINLVYGYVQTAIPKLYFRDPHITVNAKQGNAIPRARLLQVIVNYLIGELNIKAEVKKVIRDTLLVGHGWLKFGYAGSFDKEQQEAVVAEGQVPVPGEIPLPAPGAEQPEVAVAAASTDPTETREFVKDEEIFVVYLPWDEVVFDPDAKDPPYDARWIAHSVIKPLKDVKEAYPDCQSLKSNVTKTDDAAAKAGDQPKGDVEDPNNEMVKYWEITDKEGNQIMVVADGYDHFLRRDENVYEMEGLNFAMLKFNTVPGRAYPLSDIYLIEPQILERIKLRAMQLNHLKRHNRQSWIEKGALDEAEMAKYQLGTDGALIQTEPGKQGPKPIEYAAMQLEIDRLDSLIQRDMDAVIGQSDVERGGQARTETNTLGELESQLAGTQNRAAERQDILEDFIEEVSRKLIQLLKQFQHTERFVRATGDKEMAATLKQMQLQGDMTGFKFTREQIQGDYDVEAKAGSMAPVNRQSRGRMLLQAVKLGPAIGIMPGGKISRIVGREILRDLEIKEVEQAYEEELAELEAKAAVNKVLGPGGAPPPAAPPGGPALPPLPGGAGEGLEV